MKSINITLLKKMFEGGSRLIGMKFSYINELNVFPVPDGDTGTNMKITIAGAIDSLNNNLNSTSSFTELGKIFSRGLLMNARGNSGVIFSQIMKGFVQGLENAKNNELTIGDLINCFKLAKKVGYTAVVNPVEGTILTVIRVISEELEKKESEFETVMDLFDVVVEIAKKTVDLTPTMLKELKEAKVVDSGGYGLFTFFEGMQAVLENKENVFSTNLIYEDTSSNNSSYTSLSSFEEDGHGYCTEFLLNLNLCSDPKIKKIKFDEKTFKKNIKKYVESVVLVVDENLVRVHAHSLQPNVVLQEGLKYGEFVNVKIENMNLQVSERNKNNKKSKLSDEVALVVTVPSLLLQEMLLQNYDVKYILNTGLNGAPSVKDFCQLIESTNSRNVIVAVDDSNFVLAIESSKKELARKKIKIEIVNGYNFIDILMATAVFDKKRNLKDNFRNINKTLRHIASASVSKSVRTVKYPHITVKKNDYISIINKRIGFSNKLRKSLLKQTISHLIKKIKKPELVFIVYGENVDVEEAHEIEEFVNETFGIYCETFEGGQKIYDYYIGVQ